MTEERLADRYVLLRELGRGGMATVFEARDERLGRKVAVKVLHSATAGGLERLKREAGLLAAVKHPNLVEIHDFHEHGPRAPFVVMELVEGQTLRGFAAALQPVATMTAVALCWELSRALAAAHARGIVHRDVKPENVLVSTAGLVKLTDFGIAAAFDQERLTTTGAVTGSLAYMAPERLDGAELSASGDVYSVAVVLFELCTGQTPFAGRGAAAMAAATMTKDAPVLADVAPRVPAEVSELVGRCLARDPGMRPRDAGALATELERLLREKLGSAADATRALLEKPAAENERLAGREFGEVMARARHALERGQGAFAAKLLNSALTLRPDSTEVRDLLQSQRPKRRVPVLAVALGLAGTVAAGAAWWGSRVPAAVPVVAAAPTPVPVPRPAAVEVEPPPTPKPVKRPAPSPAPAGLPVALKVAARPWAEVFVDGESQGYTPRVREVMLTPGVHTVRLDNPRCEPLEKRVEVKAGAALSPLDVTLTMKKALVTLTAPPGAELYVDGVRVTVGRPQPVEHGEHTAVALLPGGEKVTKAFRAEAGEAIQVELK
ncbi:MAG: protein kinase [Myxococcaceae bacterium]|nr:protein kinase [Myxococcaceae bacterium]